MKLSLEIRKLEAELTALRTPSRTPTVIAAAIVAIVSLAANAFQWVTYSNKRDVAELAAANLELKTQLLRNQESQLNEAIAAKNAELAQLKSLVVDAAGNLERVPSPNPDIREAQSQLNSAVQRLEATATPIRLAAVGITASPGTIRRGESTQLRWSSTDATDVVISPLGPYGLGLGVFPSGDTLVSPSVTTTYTIRGKNRTGSVARAEVTVIVE